MPSRGKIYLLAAVLIVVVLGGAALALRPAASATGAALYGYPLNARQLIAAGLSGRPAPHSRA